MILVSYSSSWIGMHAQIDLSPQASEAWLWKLLRAEHPLGLSLVFSACETRELCCCALFSLFVIKPLKIAPGSGSSLRYHCFSGAFLRPLSFPDLSRKAYRKTQFLANTSPWCCWCVCYFETVCLASHSSCESDLGFIWMSKKKHVEGDMNMFI